MDGPPVRLSTADQVFIELVIPEVCSAAGWTCHVCAAHTEHVHALVSAPAEGAVVRALLKRGLTQRLNARADVPGSKRWWAKGGSVKWIWRPAYFRRAFEYIANQRATERHTC
jgi:REP element-mobilizing transposase RayT